MNAAQPAYARRVRLDQTDLWKGSMPLLAWLDIELTERCNCDCIHCSINRPAGDRAANRREMSTDEIKGLLESAAALGCLTVRFTGGEPLLREDFEEIYVFARKLGLRVLLFTNATLITPRLAGLLAAVPPREKVEVTIYGTERDICEAVTRTPGSFEAARRGLELLVEHRIPFVVRGAYLPVSKRDAHPLEDWASRLTGQTRTALAMFFDLRSRRDEGKNALIRSLRVTVGEAGEMASAWTQSDRADRLQFLARHARIEGDRLFTCLTASGKGAVDAFGVFQYCLLLRHPDTVFDLKARGNLRAAVTGHLPAVRAIRARNPEYLSRCGRCFLKAFCLQCPAKSWAEHGTLDTPVDYFCDIAHVQVESLGLIAPGERAWTVEDWPARLARAGGSVEAGPGLGRECVEEG